LFSTSAAYNGRRGFLILLSGTEEIDRGRGGRV
jgi:hypothetical protein